MPTLPLQALLDQVKILGLTVPPGLSAADFLVDSLVYDSRESGPQSLFFALPGTHTDGHHHLEEAAARGCRCVVVSRPPALPRPDTCYVLVADTRFSLSPFSAAFFGHPSREISVAGVTGTDGKSSTVSYLHQLLELSGKKAGFFSTVEWKTGETTQHNLTRQSTPEAPQIQKILREMVDHGQDFAVLESTSHGLSPRTNRLGDVVYTCAVFTNVTTEHLEFHGSVEAYRKDKTLLFSALQKGPEKAFGVVNLDDPHHGLFIEAAGDRRVLTYSTQNAEADLFATIVQERPDALELDLVYKGVRGACVLSIPGRFNAENLMAALLAASGLLCLKGDETSPLDLLPVVPQLRPVKGRMTPLRQGQPFAVLLDYAHTPGAFEKLLPAVKAVTKGRLIAVFGSAGERDKTKRPLQGALADRWADIIVLTDEDPRLEDSGPIIEDIAAGIKNKREGFNLFKVVPREAALLKAFSLAHIEDTVVLLGKGHEQSLVTAEGSRPYDEETAARKALAQLGWK